MGLRARQVELTANGTDLLAVTQPGLKAIDGAMSGIEQAAKGSTRSISIGTTPWMAANVLLVNETVCMHSGFRKTIGLLQRRGIEVRAVDISLLIGSEEPVLTQAETYQFAGEKMPADRYLHREWDTYIALREKL